jgi:membrane-associated protease RseP (regulator of RpoE activity)
VNALALVAFAAETGTHLVREPRDGRFASFARRFDESAYLEMLAGAGVRWVAKNAPDFPPLLRSIHDPPPGLFVRGAAEVELLRQPAVALVGARSCSPYGAQVARMLGRELAAAGLVVVSGLARGIDGEAHRGALDAGGPTVAVLGCGVDRDYPAAHGQLAARIRETGLIVERTFAYIGRLLTGRESPEQLSGILRIGHATGEVLAAGGVPGIVYFTAVLSVSIGLFNLFPIPMLDGGHLLYYLVEAIRGRPLSPRIQDIGFRIGFALVVLLFIFVTFNDIAYFS